VHVLVFCTYLNFQLCLKRVGGILQKVIVIIIRSPQILGAWATKFYSVAPNIFNSIIVVLSKNMKHFCVISYFRHEVYENCALLGYYTDSGNFLPMFRDNLSVPSSGVKPLNIDPQRWDR